MTTETEIAWAAGLFEGEGSIGFRGGSRGYVYAYLNLQLRSTDQDVVYRFHQIISEGNVNGPYVNSKG